MIASQKVGKSFMGAFRYNEKKTLHPDKNKRAIMLDSNFTAIDQWGIQREVEMVRSLRPSLNRYVFHTSLNFHKEDRLDDETLLTIAHDYLLANGFDDNQYMIYRHHDADHPHLHLLVNRIRYDGSVVSDSNNYRQSEAVLRKLEERYNLITVKSAHQVAKERRSDKFREQYNHAAGDRNYSRAAYPGSYLSLAPDSNQSTDANNTQPTYHDNNRADERNNTITKRAPTKDELEMISRTGVVSEKLLLQEKLTMLVPLHNVTIQEFIAACNTEGIDLLFNQASTGRVSGITYFHNDFKIRGQALGNRFKWGELIKYIDYEQSRDSAAISAANDRTKQHYGEGEATSERRVSPVANNTSRKPDVGADIGTQPFGRGDTTAITEKPVGESGSYRNGNEADKSQPPGADLLHSDNRHPEFDRLDTALNVNISDDVDDEAIYGKDRHRQKKARTNRR